MTTAYVAELLKNLKKHHKEKYGCSLGKMRCSECDVVANVDQFAGKLRVCRPCHAIKQKYYYEKRVNAQALESGVPRKHRGRPKIEVPIVLRKTKKK